MENTEAKRNIKLIAFDLDGTTLHGFAELSERNRRAMEKANGADILVVPATGRVRNFIPPCLTELPFIRYAITSNGGAVWDILENKVLCTDLIPTETALEVQKIFDDYELYVEYYVHGRGVTKRGNPDKARTIFGFPEEKYYFLTKGIELTFSNVDNIEINKKGCDKGTALYSLCKVLGIDPQNTMAAGDNGNDLGMLKAAGFAAVVGNGIEEAKAIADAVVAPCIEDGFAEAVERFALR